MTQLKFDPQNALVSDVTNMLFGKDPTDERKEFIFSLLGQSAELAKDTIDAIQPNMPVEEIGIPETVSIEG